MKSIIKNVITNTDSNDKHVMLKHQHLCLTVKHLSVYYINRYVEYYTMELDRVSCCIIHDIKLTCRLFHGSFRVAHYIPMMTE